MKPKQPKTGITLRLPAPAIFWRVLGAAVAVCASIPLLLLQTGCSPGIIAVFGEPTSSEKKVPAEYNLAVQKGAKILILVDQPTYLDAHPNLRFFVTDAISKTFQLQLKIPASLIIDYDTLADYRSETADFSLQSPEQVGSALGADFVLHVVVSNYQITQEGDITNLSAKLDAQATLIKTATGEKVWPMMEPSRLIQVGCESERRGPDTVAVRMASAAARCITRYLYDCPKNQFKILDDRTNMSW